MKMMRKDFLSWALVPLLMVLPSAYGEEAIVQNELLVVVGASGTPEYGKAFDDAQLAWEKTASMASVRCAVIDPEQENPLSALEAYLKESPKDSAVPLWVVLIGHGTYTDRQARFNLEGPDLSAEVLNEWLEPFKRPTIVVNSSSSSGAFLPVLSKEGRIVVTGTKSGGEINYTLFGGYLADALTSPETDLNNDGENSLYECFYSAARQTAAFYEQEGRIATETPMLDDNGDGKGTTLEAIDAYEAGGESKTELDGSYAKRWALVLSPEEQALPSAMRQQRNHLESQVDDLRRHKADFAEDAYYEKLEKILRQIAALYEENEAVVPTVPEESSEVLPEDQAIELPDKPGN